MVRGLEDKSCEENLKELDIYIATEEKAKGYT